MKIPTSFLSALLLIGALAVTGAADAQDVLAKVELEPGSNYCHMKFPAIREDTLNSNRPVLKDAGTADIVDYYGSCDHNPLGKDEIASQREGSKEWRRVHESGE
jgi:hypothetical protein